MTENMKQGRPTLSVIVPAHNAARTLERCVRSALEGEAPFGVEVIIAENTSQDDTPALARALQRRWPGRVRALTSAPGVSNARNAAMAAAGGEWLIFLDADDEIKLDAICALAARAAEARADIAAGDILRVYQNSVEAHSYAPGPVVWEGDGAGGFGSEVLKVQTFMGNAWGKVFNRAWLEANGLRFNPALTLAEDAEFMLRCALRARRVLYRPGACYSYWLNMNSSMRSYSEALPGEYARSIDAIGEDIRLAGAERCRARYHAFALYHLLLIAVNHSFHPRNPRPAREQLRRYRALAKSEPFATALKHVRYRDFSMTRALPLWFTAHGLHAGVMLVARVRHIMFRLK